jgi:WD40 repeat protein
MEESICSNFVSASYLSTAPERPLMPAITVHRRKRILGFLALVAWIGVAWTFWQAHSVRARQSIPLDLPIRFCPSASPGGPIADINNESWNEPTFLDAATGRKQVILKGSLQGIRGATLARDRHTVWTSHDDGSVKIWDATEEGNLVTLQLPKQRMALDLSPDGKIVAAWTKEDKVELWAVASQKRVAALAGIFRGQCARFLPDGQTLATLTEDGVKLWDLGTQQPGLLLSGRFSMFAMAPDGRSLATCDYMARVTIWDTTTGQERAGYCAPAEVQVMFFSPDSGKVCINDPPDSWLVRLYWMSGTTVQRALEFFSILPDRMETAVFDAATGSEYGRLPCPLGYVVAFADDKTLAIFPLRGAKAIELWDLPPSTAVHPFIAWACFGVATLLTGARWYAWRAVKMEQRPVPG